MGYDGSIKFDTGMDFNGFQKDANKFTGIVKGLGVFEILKKGFNAVASSIDGAVARYDTLNKFPKILEQMGYSATQASAATQKLSDGVQGLPTTLDDIVSNTQQLVSVTGDLDKSTNLALALNDAFLASGSSSQDAARGTTQYIQMLSKGKVDMQSWMTLQETMTYGLDTVAKSFGFAGSSARTDFYEALKSGEITFDQFSDRLIELDSGVGGFAEMAKTSTGGIATAFTNMKTAIVRGTTSIITSIDKGLSKTKFKSIENMVTQTGKTANKWLTKVADLMEPIAANLETIIPLVVGFTAAVTAWKVVAAVGAWFNTAALQVNLYSMSVGGAITADALHTSGLAAKEIIVGVLTGKIALATAAQELWNRAINANPIGLAVAGIIAATAATVALVNAFDKANPAAQEAASAIKDTKAATEELKDAMDTAQSSTEEMREGAKANADAIRRQTENVYNAIDAYKNQAGAIEDVEAYIQLLSKACGGLEITFDETNGTLSITREELNELANAAEDAQDVEVLQKNVEDLQKALSDNEPQIRANEKALKNLDEQFKIGAITEEYYTAETEKLRTKNEDLANTISETKAALTEAEAQYRDAYKESVTEINTLTNEEIATIQEYALEHGLSTDAIIADMERQGITFDQYKANFEDLQASVEERTDNITNSFKKIPTEFDMSAQEMLENLQSNKETYAKWEANMEEITRLLGPTAAAEFGKLGPEANSAMEEILQSPELLEQYRETLGVKIDEATGTAIENWNDPSFIGASSDALTEGAVQVQANTALPDAIAEKVGESAEAANAAVEAADFSSIGTTINDAMVTSVTKMGPQAKTAMIKAMQGIAQAITSSGPSIQSAVLTITRNMIKTLETYKTDSTRSIKAAMTAFVSAISGTRASAASAAGSVTKGAISAIDSQKSSAYSAGYNVGSYTGSGMLAGLAARESSIISKARSIANRVTATMKNALKINSPSKESQWLFEMYIQGGVVGLEKNEDKLYRTIDDIADETLKRMARISDAMDETFNRKMQVAIDAQQAKATISAQTGAFAAVGDGAGKKVINNYRMNNVYNSPTALSWRDMKLAQETQSQQFALLGG
jgi:tape measure domain-containing protein